MRTLMSGEQKLEEFLLAIDNWIECKGLPKVEQKEDIEAILNMRSHDINHLSAKECLAYAYELYAYSDYLESIKAKEKIVLDWADSSIWYIISDKMEQYGTKYTKWQEKYFRSIKENPLASEIIKVKNNAQARVRVLENKINTVKRLSEILTSLSKRK